MYERHDSHCLSVPKCSSLEKLQILYELSLTTYSVDNARNHRYACRQLYKLLSISSIDQMSILLYSYWTTALVVLPYRETHQSTLHIWTITHYSILHNCCTTARFIAITTWIEQYANNCICPSACKLRRRYMILSWGTNWTELNCRAR